MHGERLWWEDASGKMRCGRVTGGRRTVPPAGSTLQLLRVSVIEVELLTRETSESLIPIVEIAFTVIVSGKQVTVERRKEELSAIGCYPRLSRLFLVTWVSIVA
jgi:hypothetical protein